MRTVSFSQPALQQMLNQKFVNVYSNTTGDPTAGMSVEHAPRDPAGSCIRGNGKQNVQTVFMTPEGEVFHVATGFLSANDLAGEAEFALKLFDQIQDSPEDRSAIVQKGHRERLKEKGFTDQQIAATNPGLQFMMMSPTGGFSQGTQPMSMDDAFSGFIKQQFLSDNQFSITHPLISWTDLQENPAQLVGNGKSFFASSSSGSN